MKHTRLEEIRRRASQPENKFNPAPQQHVDHAVAAGDQMFVSQVLERVGQFTFWYADFLSLMPYRGFQLRPMLYESQKARAFRGYEVRSVLNRNEMKS